MLNRVLVCRLWLFGMDCDLELFVFLYSLVNVQCLIWFAV